MQKIKLTTESENTVHVDHVDVSKGVYCKWDSDKVLFAVTNMHGDIEAISAHNSTSNRETFDNLRHLMSKAVGNFFTISGQRIVLEKELTIDYLGNGDIIGFVDCKGTKGMLAYTGDGFICIIDEKLGNYCNITFGDPKDSLVAAIEDACRHNYSTKITELYKFPTRRDLYRWLAE